MSTILAEFKEEVESLLSSYFLNTYMGVNILPDLDESPEGMGDLAQPCFTFAKLLQKAPMEIAREMAMALAPKAKNLIAKVEANGPYVNFYIDGSALVQRTLGRILEEKEGYGQLPARPGKILLEHTSANPTDRLHVGRARNPLIADTLLRILRKAGHQVDVQYYLDDLGRQSALVTYGHEHQQSYQWANAQADEDPEVLAEVQSLLKRMEAGDMELLHKRVHPAIQGNMDLIRNGLTRMGIDLEEMEFVYESKFIRGQDNQGFDVEGVVESLKGLDVSQDDDGAHFIDMGPYGVSGKNTRFYFTRSDGTSLYATRDIAYHLWKYNNADVILNVLGEDHKLEAKQIAVCLELLGHKSVPEVVFYAFVSLPEGKMSTRKGRSVSIDELLDEALERAESEVRKRRPELTDDQVSRITNAVGVGSVRYNILRIQSEKMITFKWEDALSFDGTSSPFIQYAHARACSILAKENRPEAFDTSLLTHNSEISLAKTLAKFPTVIEECARTRTVHIMAGYAHSLADEFNQFYRDCPVLVAEKGTMGARLALVEAAKWTIYCALNCLGIEALEQM